MQDVLQQVELQSELVENTRGNRLRRWLRVGVVLQDAALVYAALVVAYWLRYKVQLGSQVGAFVPFSRYQEVALILLAVMLPTLLLKGAYRVRLSSEIAGEAIQIVGATTTSVAAIVVVTAMLHQFEYSRGVIVYLWFLLIGTLITGRLLTRSFQRLCHRKGWGVRKLLVVGTTESGKMIMQSVMNRRALGYEVLGFIEHRDVPHESDFGRFRLLGTVADVPALVEAGEVDDIIVALPSAYHDELWSVVNLCERHGVGLKLIPDLFEVSLSRVQFDDIDGIPLLDVQSKPLRRTALVVKRGMDIVGGSFAIFLSLPIVAVLALLIRIDSVGPAFIKQERVGQSGRRFSCFKLRTMRVDADKLMPELERHNEAQGAIFKMRNDPRCTRVGRYIRRLSLDELPQLWNVVLGDMSLVGPRPPLPRETVKYEPWQFRRLESKPGITGLWQVSGRSNLSFDEMVMMDIMYGDNWSLALDLKILMRTVSAVLAARGAY